MISLQMTNKLSSFKKAVLIDLRCGLCHLLNDFIFCFLSRLCPEAQTHWALSLRPGVPSWGSVHLYLLPTLPSNTYLSRFLD